MEVTIFQINRQIFRISDVCTISENKEGNIIEISIKGSNSYSIFRKDLIAQIKIGGQHEYKKG